MKKIFDKKTIITFIISGILFTSIGIYAASYVATDISYKKEGSEITNVNDALDDLYNNYNEFDVEYAIGKVNGISNPSVTINVPANKKKAYITINGGGYTSGTKINLNSTVIENTNYIENDWGHWMAEKYSSQNYFVLCDLTGEEGTITISFGFASTSGIFATALFI